MSIFAHLIRRRNKGYARPTPKVQESRNNFKATPFDVGLTPDDPKLVSTHPVEGNPAKAVCLFEDSAWAERPDPATSYPYLVVEYDAGMETERTGFDTLASAETYVWHRTVAMPTEEVPPAHYPDEPPVLPLSTEHDLMEEAWWSRQTGGGVVEGQPDPNDLIYSTEAADDWLDDLTADQMQALSDDYNGGFIGGFEQW